MTEQQRQEILAKIKAVTDFATDPRISSNEEAKDWLKEIDAQISDAVSKNNFISICYIVKNIPAKMNALLRGIPELTLALNNLAFLVKKLVTSFEALPDELLPEIFQHLPTQADAQTATQVCQRFNSSIKTNFFSDNAPCTFAFFKIITDDNACYLLVRASEYKITSENQYDFLKTLKKYLKEHRDHLIGNAPFVKTKYNSVNLVRYQDFCPPVGTEPLIIKNVISDNITLLAGYRLLQLNCSAEQFKTLITEESYDDALAQICACRWDLLNQYLHADYRWGITADKPYIRIRYNATDQVFSCADVSNTEHRYFEIPEESDKPHQAMMPMYWYY